MVIFPLGGAVHNFRWLILKGWPQVNNHASLTCFASLQPLTSYSTFPFWLGFPYCWRNLWGFLGKWPPKVKIPKNTCLEGISSRQTASFELSCVEIGSRVWAVRVARKEKKKWMARDPGIPPPRGGATADTIPTKFSRVVDPQDVIAFAKFEKQTIHNCDFGERLNFTILALLGPSPLTRLSSVGLPVIGIGLYCQRWLKTLRITMLSGPPN